MGAQLSTIWYVDAPRPIRALRTYPDPDLDSATSLARALFEDEVTHLGTVSLAEASAGTEDVLYIGSYPGVSVVCVPLPVTMLPSELPQHWHRPKLSGRMLFVSSSESAGLRGSFGEWSGGELRRSFSADAANIFEDHGVPQTWEQPFWAGEFPMKYPLNVLPDPQMLPFHPQHFAESANHHWLGFRYTAVGPDDEIDPDKILVHSFRAGAPDPSLAPEEPDTRELVSVGVGGQGKSARRRRSSFLLRWLGFRT